MGVNPTALTGLSLTTHRPASRGTAGPRVARQAQAAVDRGGDAEAVAAEHVEVGVLERGDADDVFIRDVVLALLGG